MRWDTNFIRIILIVIITVLIYSSFLSGRGIFAVAKLKAIDLFYGISHLIKPRQANLDKIVIISIDELSLKTMNKNWPWERYMFGLLIDKLQKYKPKLICFDFAFIGQSENKQNDLLFAKSMKEAGNAIIASNFDSRARYILPAKVLSDAALAYGFVNKPRDRDYYVRRARVFFFSKERRIIDLSFELKTICNYFDIGLSNILYNPATNAIRIPHNKRIQGDINFSIRQDGTIPINYHAKYREFNVIPFGKVLKDEFREDAFKDKIVLVSLTSEISHDAYNTPIGVLPGVVIIANELLMFLNNDFIREIPFWIDFLILMFIILLVAIVVYRVSALKGFIFSVIIILLFIGTSIYLSFRNYWADYFSVILFTSITYLGISIKKYIQLMIESVQLKTQAVTDGLTGLFVQRYFQIRIASEFTRAVRYSLDLSLIMIDVDHFKNINDTYGHQQGDLVLKSLGEILQKNSRRSDVLVRYGGEEFCVILLHASQEHTLVYAEKLRKAVEDFDFKLINDPQKTLRVTISVGVASLAETQAKTAEELIKFADTALYESKETGRNRISVYKS